MKIDETRREEWECHLPLEGDNWVFIWLGHTRGDLYGNFSFKIHGRIFEKRRGFHCNRDWFDYMLDLPLGWQKIIDSRVLFGENKGVCGVDLRSGMFQKSVNRVEDLSVRSSKR